MITGELMDFISEETVLENYKFQWEAQDPYSQVLCSTNINNGIYNVKFHQSLDNSTLKLFEFMVDSRIPHLIDGKITRQACIFVTGERLIFKVLKYTEYNDSHTFDSIDELREILRDYDLLK